MERFAFKVDNNLKANLYTICRLCGIDNPEKVNILGDCDSFKINVDDGEPELWQKIKVCVGITVSRDDKMPQTMCSLCVDKVNDFFEFREMCFATNAQTRKLLGLKEEQDTEQLDIKGSIQNTFLKRNVSAKGKRKRKSDESLLKSLAKTDFYDKIKIESLAGSPSGIPIRKKTKLSSQHSAIDVETIACMGTSGTVLQKKSKLIMPLQKRTIEQLDRNMTLKDEIKDEVCGEICGGDQMDFSNSFIAAKLNKFKQICTICEQRFTNKAQLDKHQNSIHVPNIPRYVCTACNETIKKNNDIKNHQLWHKLSKTPFICPLCEDRLMNTYAYSRHLRDHNLDLATAVIVLDRQCPQCLETFATNYLYNTHTCSIETRTCAGCNRMLKTESEYRRHAPTCSKVYINYSKHILVTERGEESSIRIKNENDVEAAVVADLGHTPPGTGFEMNSMVSLQHLAVPIMMESNQCVVIPGDQIIACGDPPITPTTSNTKLAKKANKKGVSIKELKRVDELLKSTMDTLVSIKHEPEVHMDTCDVVPEQADSGAPMDENAPNNDDEDGDDGKSTLPSDDFQGDYSDDAIKESTLLTNVSIKREPPDETERSEENILDPEMDIINIKQEITADPNKMPVLKLKITKEHGKLNSSLVQEDDLLRCDKRKKKKKRKDSDKEKEKSNDDSLLEENATMPQPDLIQIKQEHFGDDNDNDASTSEQTSMYHKNDQLVMTTIPQTLDFQIASISSGVDFKREETESETTTFAPIQVIEEQDIKPCRETLDHLMQISHVTGAMEISNRGNNVELEEQGLVQAHQQPRLQTDESNESSHLKELNTTPVSLTFTNDEHEQQNTAVPSSLPLPQIISVNSSNEVSEKSPESVAQFIIKQERFDADYGDFESQSLNEEHSTKSSNYLEKELHQNHQSNKAAAWNSAGYTNEEQAYSIKIDFNNLKIKQEKEIEVSDVQINEPTALNLSIMHNGVNADPQSAHVYEDHLSLTAPENAQNDPEEDDEGEEEEEEDDGDEVENNDVKEEFEEREYREMEIPPLLIDKREQDQVEYADYKESPVMISSRPSAANVAFSEYHSMSPTNSGPSAVALSDMPREQVSKETQLLISSAKPQLKEIDTDNDANIETGTIQGSVVQHGYGKLEAIPMPPAVITSSDNNSLETENYTGSELEGESNDHEEPIETGEELENQFNHDLAIGCHPLQYPTITQNPSVLRNLLTTPSTPAVFNSEEISATICLNGSNSVSGDTSIIPSHITTTNSTSITNTTTTTRPSEETENLMNERYDRSLRFEPDMELLPFRSRLPSNNSLLVNNDSNINEIAENNNNANIERELQDDTLNATSPSIGVHDETGEETETHNGQQVDIT